MTVSIFDLPYDKNGAPLGRWRVRHRGGLTTNLATCRFVDGVTQEPVEGIKMRHLAAAMGQDLTAEPWDAEAAREIRERVHDSWVDTAGLLSGGAPAAPEPPPAPERQDDGGEPEDGGDELDAVDLGQVLPKRDTVSNFDVYPKPEMAAGHEAEGPAEAEGDELDAMNLEQLRELAAGLLPKVDGRWSAARLREEIREAMADAE